MAQVTPWLLLALILVVWAWRSKWAWLDQPLFGRRPKGEPCEVCGRQSRRNITLTNETPYRDGGMVGGSSISATFCPDHLPE